ncbi:DsbA family protein [Mangrovicoccus algicola]|uniref:DsbA family protein n=1 Tax=Mangrovicoccus algicola TaxID=2771008 RepID=A0A8J6YZK9_9RHOB|nr:DsbA family protein [Mangrovicoccus algicola]MBE3638768.1 DsbA family protein [Mangrovicoccus algicola]
MIARRELLTSALMLGTATMLPSFSFAQDAAPENLPDIPDMVLGRDDAPVKVTEYASFTCPHCAHFHETVYPRLKEDYIDTGKVQFTFREVYFDRYGLWASMVARCGGEMRYFGIADRLFATQRDWTGLGDPAGIAGALKKVGLTAGLTQEQVDACLNDNATAQALVNWYGANAKADEVTATPSFLIDGEPYSNMSFEQFAEILDEKLGA